MWCYQRQDGDIDPSHIATETPTIRREGNGIFWVSQSVKPVFEMATRKWYDWYSPEDTPEERKLIRKLDLLIVPYAFTVYWVKYIDQGNISKYPR
jgi:hypothetical protein